MSSETTASPAAAMAIDIRRFPWMRPLARDYAYGFERVAPFFSGNPARREDWAAVIARRQARAASRDALIEVLTAQQQRREAPSDARPALETLRNPQSLAIVTGQQAGLFGGPLFTLLKALTAMKLARRTGAEHGVPVVPVFWIDAEDHDWPEVSSCTVLDEESRPQTIRLADPEGAGHLPVGRLRLDARVTDAVQALRRVLPATEFSASLSDDLAAAYRPGVSMADAFGAWLERTLGPHGLVVYDASDPSSKALARHVFTHELTHPGRTAALAASAGTALTAAGYHAQVTSAEGTVALFHLNAGRQSIRFSGSGATVGDEPTTLATLAEEAARSPEHFSPNVLLRPIVQDALFPTVAYVAGPSELAYLGQLRDVYAHFDVPMPLMYQRVTATIADSTTLRFLSRYELPFETLRAQDEAALNQLLEHQLPPTVEQALSGVASEVGTRVAGLVTAVSQIDPTLEGTVRSTLGRMEHDLQTLRNKVIQAAKRRDETLRRQFHHAQALTFPNGHPQEREIGSIWFHNRYGPALVPRLLEDLPLDMGHHWLLTV